jgi:murein tripeptide amidase MpaA
VAAFALACVAPATASAASLQAYRVDATPKNLERLAESGFDVTEGRDTDARTVEIVGTPAQVDRAKVDADLVRAQPRTLTTRAASPTDGASDKAYRVWTKYDAVPGDGKEQYTEQYARLVAERPGLVAKRVTGTTYGGREIVALQVTKGATGADIPGRPAVLYNAMQHAREWLAGETCRRSLEYFVDNYGKTTSAGREVTQLVDTTELWFVCVNNPDGYEYTFTPGNRLWRKNLRDNDGNGIIAPGDGVDPNRNFSSNWGLDDEGSSPDPADETYRGPSPASEPETKAMERLFAEIHPVFQKNDHTAAQLLLYPQGFQQDTPSADNEIFTALAGDPFKPGIPGFLPELSAGLYITNGDFTDWAYNTQNALSFTPEGTAAEDPDVSGFEYPDSPLQVDQEFRRHLPFALDLAKSADDPSEPDSHLDTTARDFVVDAFGVSYGDPQPVNVTLKRKLGAATMRFRVNGGKVLEVPTADWNGGERYFKDKGVFYRRARGVVSGTDPGDSVEVWFVAGGKESQHFTYQAKVESKAPVLLLSDEDWSGKQPNAAPLAGPQYLEAYKQLLTKAGVTFDVYDVSESRTPPHQLGVLGHYSHVIWYTGDDYVPRNPEAPGGSGIAKLAVDTQNRVRDFLNEGGKLFYTGENAGRVFAEGYTYNPFEAEERETCATSDQCIAVQDDFLQYWLGAGSYISGGGGDPDGNPYSVRGFAAPFDFGAAPLTGPTHTASFLITSSLYDPQKYPQWAGFQKAMEWVRPGGSPFEPVEGEWFASASPTNASYNRLLTTATVPAGGSTLAFKTSYDLEADFDYAFVEVHTKGQDDWTTLEGNLTSQETGLSCPSDVPNASNWQSLHPFLARYQTKVPSSTDPAGCEPTGTTGAWHALGGNSGGWKDATFDIPAAFRGKEVEIAITVATDPGTLGLGFWVDDVRLGGTQLTGFETGKLDPFTAAAPPEGTVSQANGWNAAQSTPFVEGAGVKGPDTVYTGFGLEKVTAEADRLAILRDTFEHLGAPSKPRIDAPEPRPAGGPGSGGPGNPGGGGNGNGDGKPRSTKPRLMLKRLRASSTREVTLTVGCAKSAGADGCRGTVALLRGRKVAGRASYRLAAGKQRKVTVRLSRATYRLLTRKGQLQMTVRVSNTSGPRSTVVVRRTVTVRAPARTRR